MATFMLSAEASPVEASKSDPEVDELRWSYLMLQAHHHSQAVRTWAGFGPMVCSFGAFTERWGTRHGCATRIRALETFRRHASPAEIDAAVHAGYISRFEANHGVQERTRSHKKRRLLRRRGQRPDPGPAHPVPYPLEAVGIS